MQEATSTTTATTIIAKVSIIIPIAPIKAIIKISKAPANTNGIPHDADGDIQFVSYIQLNVHVLLSDFHPQQAPKQPI